MFTLVNTPVSGLIKSLNEMSLCNRSLPSAERPSVCLSVRL